MEEQVNFGLHGNKRKLHTYQIIPKLSKSKEYIICSNMAN